MTCFRFDQFLFFLVLPDFVVVVPVVNGEDGLSAVAVEGEVGNTGGGDTWRAADVGFEIW